MPHFQVYGQGKIIVNLMKKHQYATYTWCEQYIECINMSIPHLKNKWLHMKIWHLVYVSFLFSIIAFIPTTWVLHFVTSKEGQDSGKCQFLCKKDIMHLDNELQQA